MYKQVVLVSTLFVASGTLQPAANVYDPQVVVNNPQTVALFQAIEQDDGDLVRALTAANDYELSDAFSAQSYMTAFMYAIFLGRTDIVHILLENAANAAKDNTLDETPLHVCVKSVQEANNQIGPLLLMKAACHFNYAVLHQTLVFFQRRDANLIPDLLNLNDGLGNTALHNMMLSVTRQCFNHLDDDNEKRRANLIARITNCLNLLLENGAQINAVNNAEKTPRTLLRAITQRKRGIWETMPEQCEQAQKLKLSIDFMEQVDAELTNRGAQ